MRELSEAMSRLVIPTILLLFTAVSAPAPILEPSPSEQAKPKRSEAKAAPKKSESAPVDQRAIETKLKDFENKWEASFTTHDPSVVESLIADDFAGVNWAGKVMDKSRLISSLKTDTDTYQSAVTERVSVHASSPTSAVVIGIAHEKGMSKNGQPFDRMFRFTDTWMERHGRWQCTASQVAKIPLQ